eukprot:TRINITY_DN24718_c0_g1_i2.p1 TRINITY_DN24718_c0_g1~~TRINITY_DN24718_c0_g1_i2.p1  ORF type:complete len:264 (+),score=19.50 TRINITY_DN24718_c0_g1_i2:41-793(+)
MRPGPAPDSRSAAPDERPPAVRRGLAAAAAAPGTQVTVSGTGGHLGFLVYLPGGSTQRPPCAKGEALRRALAAFPPGLQGLWCGCSLSGAGRCWCSCTGLGSPGRTPSASSCSVDPRRVLLTGISAGGVGCWILLAAAPSRWAAAVPIAGAGRPEWAVQGAKGGAGPIWAFHAQNDVIMPVEGTDELVRQWRAAGGQANYSRPEEGADEDPAWKQHGIPPMEGHAVHVSAYYGAGGEEVYSWLLAQRRRD